MKFSTPQDACPPTEIYSLYRFGGDKISHTYTLQTKDNSASAFLIGTDEAVCHIVLEGEPHEETLVSKQHCVVQFRKRPTSDSDFIVVPYLLDLESKNGTSLNGSPVEPARFYELREKDLIKLAGQVELVFMQK